MFGMEKCKWCGYPMVNNFEYVFIHLDRIHEYDRQMNRYIHRQTPHDDIGRTCIASRSKNIMLRFMLCYHIKFLHTNYPVGMLIG